MILFGCAIAKPWRAGVLGLGEFGGLPERVGRAVEGAEG